MEEQTYYNCYFEIQNKEQIKVIISNDKTDQDEIIQNQIPITIEFNNNEIIIGNNSENSIKNIFKEIIEKPKEIKKYEIEYQNKNYKLTSDILFSIILNKYKNIIEKKGIINECFLIIQEEITQESKERIKEILKIIDIPKMKIVKQKPNLKQRKIFNEIIKKQESFEKYKQEVEKINKSIKELNLENIKEINVNEEY